MDRKSTAGTSDPTPRITQNVLVTGTCPNGHPVTLTRAKGAPQGPERCPQCSQPTEVS